MSAPLDDGTDDDAGKGADLGADVDALEAGYISSPSKTTRWMPSRADGLEPDGEGTGLLPVAASVECPFIAKESTPAIATRA